ncbi:sensor histidine kinase [Streptomyces sp. NBC_00338]|uniref:sensor histidine kinase n=1 Tax=Streptomyces sp. NBC_00338 TaxID=2975715 RepID=UPI0022506D92|nr:histidine kinase [Streptomyces sp. NBC_00338]MCX5142539.1 histidine kinase [Streptomyces sp. NBC_00338]
MGPRPNGPALTGGPDAQTPESTPGHVPALPIQLNALQALCRQLFGFRLAMTALAAPFALTGVHDELGSWLVGAAVLVTVMVSYLLMRDWERFGPILLRHPALLAVDMLFGALLLFAASPGSTLSYVTVCTPLLAGLVYGWRGGAIFAALQSLLLAASYGVSQEVDADASALLVVGLCIMAGAVGSTLRSLLLRFGAASQALTETRARLAVSGAVEEERARLAREMHDSVAKTLHGLAMAADGLASTADRMDPLTVKHQAELVARSARRAAAESRELLSDLRRESGLDGGVDVVDELNARTADFERRHGVKAVFRRLGDGPVPPIPHAIARHALTIATEAMENAHRHARPSYVEVSAGLVRDVVRISVYDDGEGLPRGTSLADLRKAGHFGLVGMVERAASIGARIRIGRGRAERGTEVRLDLSLAAMNLAPPVSPSPPAYPPLLTQVPGQPVRSDN